MKKNLRSACLLFLVFIFFVSGFVSLASGEDAYDYSFNENNYIGKWGNLNPPTSVYNIWGYPDRTYSLTTSYNILPENLNNTTMVFYWDCKTNPSDYTSFQMSEEKHQYRDKKKLFFMCDHRWNDSRTYYVSVGMFQKGKPVNVSYWVPIEIINNTVIEVQNFSMLRENEGFDCSNRTYNASSLANFSKNDSYCGYVDNDYSFSVNLNASSVSSEDNRTINETTTVVKWGDNTSDDSILRTIDNNTENDVSIKNISDDESTKYNIKWKENFTHEWHNTGQKNISASSFHWDPLNGDEMHSNYSNSSEYKNISILIIQDPKSFVFYPLKGTSFNLHNWGIFLSIIGLIIFYFTYTRNNVPIEISIFGLKPFYLKSVNSLTGTLIFVAGMYLYFVFGRCPWDIPIVSSSNLLSNTYFSILYREYGIKQWSIPYLSILIGMLDVIILSLIIHLIAIPFYKGEFNVGEFLRRKLSSTSAQPELVLHSVENKINQKN